MGRGPDVRRHRDKGLDDQRVERGRAGGNLGVRQVARNLRGEEAAAAVRMTW